MTNVTAADRRTVTRLVVWVFALYALTMAGRVVSGDGETMFQTTRAIVERGQLSIDQRPEAAIGRGGRYFSKYGLGQSVVQAPFVVAGRLISVIAPTQSAPDLPARFLAGLTNVLVTPVGVGILWMIAKFNGLGSRGATGIAIATATTTLLWPYSRADFAEPLQATALLAALLAGLILHQKVVATRSTAELESRTIIRWGLAIGTAIGVAFLTKAASLILAPAIAIPVLVTAWRLRLAGTTRTTIRGLTGAITLLASVGLPVAGAGAGQALLNWFRFGNPFEFGYGDEPSTGFTTPLFDGIGYLLWSSGKGLVWFTLPAVVGGFLQVWLVRRRPIVALVALSVFGTQLWYFSRWWAWHGDWSWGPRYLYVTVPFLMLGWIAPLLAWPKWHWSAKTFTGLVAVSVGGFGLYVNVLGVAIDYGAYYSVVGNQLGRGVDVRDARTVAPFSPLLGHQWLLQASLFEVFGPTHKPPDNPYRYRYPWATAFPERVPEAPERAYGFDLWWAARRGTSRFLDYWASLSAIWIGVVVVRNLPTLFRTGGHEAAWSPPPTPDVS
ncbi:MAG: hypothetical protein NTX54_04190 [Chloroflexi bacterium]|nr:hypothetical protein [Chloroflexota bacterium]